MRLPLTGKPYTSKSDIASNQVMINLYAELNNDHQAPVPITHYLMPGTVLFGTPANPAASRGSYRTSLGTSYVVVGPTVYFVATNGALVFVGSIPDRASQVIMADNGLAVVLVDGVEGWAIDMASNAFGQIIDPAFYGADFVVFLDTFFVFNRPDTNQFYISLSMVTYALLTAGTAFDPLDIAAKSGSADFIVGISTTHKELWLIGELTTEIWIGTGAADFYFQLQQGAYVDHGCAAPFSIASLDVVTFWIMQDKQGSGIVVKGAAGALDEISSPGIVNIIKNGVFADAVGTCFQIEDHVFYVVSLPTQNKTIYYDLKSDRWGQWSWLDVGNGSRNRHRIQSAFYFNGKNLISDWEDGTVWQLDVDTLTDNGDPIIRTRTFAHMVDGDFNRVIYQSFDADMEVGTSPQVDESAGEELPAVSLSWSDDRGKTFGQPVEQSLGNLGEYLTTVSWNRLGQARDRVFKLEWSAAVVTALNGAFITLKPSRS